MTDPVKLSGVPAKIFISVDERTGRSTLSFAPPDVGAPVVREADARGEHAVIVARQIAASYPGCAIDGPHYHASRATPAKRRRPPR